MNGKAHPLQGVSKGLFGVFAFLAGLLRPVIHIRVGLIHARSIGRISGNMEYYFRKVHLGDEPANRFDILIAEDNPVNTQIMRMIERKAQETPRTLLIRSAWLWHLVRDMQEPAPNQPGRQGVPPDSPLWLNLRHAGFLVEWRTWQDAPPQFSFSADEEREGEDLLALFGIPADAPFVVMHARDKAYTDSPDFIRRYDDPLCYDDFRDCDIETYLDAADWLTEQGFWVIRAGHQVEGPLSSNNPMVIDYAGRIRRHIPNPDFADVYLQAKCRFFVGCTAGIYYLSHIFNVPMAFVNMIPLAECGRLDHDLFILKRYWNRKLDRFMTFREMAERGADWNRIWHDKLKAYADEGIEFIDSTPGEILELVQEMVARLDGTWKSEAGDKELQDKFRDIFPADNPMINFPGYLGAKFTRQSRDQLN